MISTALLTTHRFLAFERRSGRFPLTSRRKREVLQGRARLQVCWEVEGGKPAG